MSSTRTFSVVSLVAGLLIVSIAGPLGYPVVVFCSSSSYEIMTGLSFPTDCFGPDAFGGYNWKLYILATSCAGMVVGLSCLAASWALATTKKYSRSLWLTVCGLASFYFLALPPLPRVVPNVVMVVIFVVLLAVSYIFLPRGDRR